MTSRYTLAVIDEEYPHISHQDIVEYVLAGKVLLLCPIIDQSDLIPTEESEDINSPELPEALALDPFNLFQKSILKNNEQEPYVSYNLFSLVPKYRLCEFDEIFYLKNDSNIDYSKIVSNEESDHDNLYISKLNCLKNSWSTRDTVNPLYSGRLDLLRHLKALKEKFNLYIFNFPESGRTFLDVGINNFQPEESRLSFYISRFIPIYDLSALDESSSFEDILSEVGGEYEYNINCKFSELFITEKDFHKLIEKNKVISIDRSKKVLNVCGCEYSFTGRDRIDVLLIVLNYLSNNSKCWQTYKEIKSGCSNDDEKDYFKGSHGNFPSLIGTLELTQKKKKGKALKGADIISLFVEKNKEARVVKYRLKSLYHNINVILK